jgi:hypothetical protein
MKRLLILNVLLLAIIVGLMVQIFALWWRAEAEVEAVAPRDAKMQRLELPPAAPRPPSADLATDIADKDLFDASRTAAQTATGPTVQPSPPPPLNLALLGVTVAGRGREALFKDPAQPKALWLREGEEFNGYTVKRIDATSVVVQSPAGGEQTLVINVEKGRGGGAPMAGPGGVQPTQAGVRRGRPTPHATPVRATRGPGSDVREKIERLREEARKRRARPHAH